MSCKVENKQNLTQITLVYPIEKCHTQLSQLDIVDFESATHTIPIFNNCNFETIKEFSIQ